MWISKESIINLDNVRLIFLGTDKKSIHIHFGEMNVKEEDEFDDWIMMFETEENAQKAYERIKRGIIDEAVLVDLDNIS